MGKRKKDTKQADLFNIEEYLATAPCVPAIRPAVASWRENNYKGITSTTRELLNYWFKTDHILPNGTSFNYYPAQREAIETLIYIFEVEKIRSRKSLLEKFASNSKDLRLPPYDDFSRYCIKMATGSGKTKVMALAVVWQYFNAVKENDEEFAKNFLLIAPNVIVLDRLKTDFTSGRIFKSDPMFPKHFDLFWDFEFYMRGDTERTSSTGSFYLTNIQQFYERADINSDEPEEMTNVLGSKPQTKKIELTDFDERISNKEGKLLVLNDEAHHTHDEDNEWNKTIRKLHTKKIIISQLDFSATPRYSKGSLFAWTVYDYPLKQAILDSIVKRPIKGISKIQETKSDIASVRYAGFLTASVERWKEYHQQLNPLNKSPILFVMMDSTQEANDIGHWLRTKYPALFGGDKTLIIHTDRKGEVSKSDLDDARKTAREVDLESSRVNAIVSVLMLREGWDVQNVTVVVGLRPYTSKANILPEQTIGRGLRLMFRKEATGFNERVDIIGNKAFLQFVDDLEKLEEIKLDTFEIGKDKLRIITIFPVDEKKAFDIGIPDLTPLLERKKSLTQEINAVDVTKFNINPLPLKPKEIEETKTFIYEGFDILTDEKLLERVYKIPPAQTAEEVIGYYARRISQNVKLPSQFSSLAPKIKEFFEVKAFGKKVDLSDNTVIQAMGSNIAGYVVIKEFEKALREVVVEEKIPQLLTSSRLLSTTSPFPFSKTLYDASKAIYNYVPCDNEFEKTFAKFLESALDVEAFAKLPLQFGFSVNYTDSLANIRHYFPDFVLRLRNKVHWLIETKGREDIEVQLKDAAAINWCNNASQLTNVEWEYLKVPQKDFEKLYPSDFEELKTALFDKGLFN
jgi:type III restriction enzyme